MTRNFRKPRSIIANKGKFGRLIPAHMGLLCPGETVHQHRAVINLSTLPVKYALSGATFDVWSYILPIRSVWPEFEQFTLDDGQAYLADGADDKRFPGSRLSSLGYDAYEMIVNQFFRTDEDSVYSYDALQDLAAIPVVDMTGELGGSNNAEAEDVTLDVSGGTLSMNELAKARAEHRYEKRMESFDGEYETYLRNQGVRDARKYTNSPEFIGHGRKFIRPRKTVDQTDGFTKQHFALEFDLKLNKKRFVSEHSLVITVCALRPKLYLTNEVSALWHLQSPEKWPQKGQLTDSKQLESDDETLQWGRTGTNPSIDDLLFTGDSQVHPDLSSKYVNTYDPSSEGVGKFPLSQWDDFVDDTTPLGTTGEQFVFEGFVSTSVATPLRDDRIS